jgi:hypothetical protein
MRRALCAMLFDKSNMQRAISILFFLTVFMQACSDRGQKVQTSSVDISGNSRKHTSLTKSFAYQNEQEYLSRKRLLCRALAMYDIEKGVEEYELRMWLIPSMWDPSILYVLKKSDTVWTLFHYQFYTMRSTNPNHYYDNPIIDSVVMESVKPQKTNWQTYINSLHLDSLWNLHTESSINGKAFAMLDGHRYLLEFSDKGKYKYLFYTTPEYFQDKDINHKSFADFKKRLVEPIIYNGMRNP